MHPTDRAEFARVVNGLAAIKGKELTTEALSLWWSAMQEWSIADFKAAASHLVSSCQFMPTPYDFQQLRLAAEPTAAEAWEKVLGGAPLVPGSREDRAARIACGSGQFGIRHADIERDLPFIQRRFLDAYNELRDADNVREALPQIASKDLPRLRNAIAGALK